MSEPAEPRTRRVPTWLAPGGLILGVVAVVQSFGSGSLDLVMFTPAAVLLVGEEIVQAVNRRS